jgi:hypothetical protein
LQDSFRWLHGTFRIAARCRPHRVNTGLFTLAAGMSKFGAFAKTTANSGRNLTGDNENKKNGCDSFQHEPVSNMKPRTLFVNKMFIHEP